MSIGMPDWVLWYVRDDAHPVADGVSGLLAALLAFAAGALTAALAFELFGESFTKGGHVLSGIGFAAVAGVFVVIDVLLERRRAATGGSGVGVVLLAGVTLDGVPENLALGTTLAGSGGSLALLAAIVVSNFPEAQAGGVIAPATEPSR